MRSREANQVVEQVACLFGSPRVGALVARDTEYVIVAEDARDRLLMCDQCRRHNPPPFSIATHHCPLFFTTLSQNFRLSPRLVPPMYFVLPRAVMGRGKPRNLALRRTSPAE